MARMIPPAVDDSTVSSAERRIFDMIRLDPGTESWVVLHSLGLTRRGKKPYGEADFLLIIPGAGIIVLEVKGGRVSCSSGVWLTADRNGRTDTMKRSPFMQAREDMFEIRKRLIEHFPDDEINNMMFGYAVVFPDVLAPPETVEFEPWEVIDRSDLLSPVSVSIHSLIRNQREKLGGLVERYLPDIALAERLRQFLRPDFERIIARSATIRESEDKILRLTDDQYDALDRLMGNSRCLIEGAAGTGKTVLAIEYARRVAAGGGNVLLLCNNRILGEWLSCQFNSQQGRITAGRFNRIFREMVINSAYKDEYLAAENGCSATQLFNDILPFYTELAISSVNVYFDCVILDEAQDLMRPAALSIINGVLRGGLAGGRWAFFGDFTRQSVYSSDITLPQGDIASQIGSGIYYTIDYLNTNCRNTRRIGRETAMLSGFDRMPYRPGMTEGLSVDYRYWESDRDQQRRLTDVIAELVRDGVEASDIVILSPYSFASSVASRVEAGEHFRVREIIPEYIGKQDKGIVGFSTIRAFKGMESPVVLLCDIQQTDSDEPQSMLYVGMSRARSHLVMLVGKSIQSALQSRIGRLLIEWGTER